MSRTVRPTRISNLGLFVLAGLLVGLALALLVSPWASGSPDGLEKVAEDEGFADTAREHDLGDSPLADYGTEGVDHEGAGTGISGVIGTLLTFGAGLALVAGARALGSRRRDRSGGGAGAAPEDGPGAGSGSGSGAVGPRSAPSAG